MRVTEVNRECTVNGYAGTCNERWGNFSDVWIRVKKPNPDSAVPGTVSYRVRGTATGEPGYTMEPPQGGGTWLGIQIAMQDDGLQEGDETIILILIPNEHDHDLGRRRSTG